MTREEIYNQCVQKIDKTNGLMLELTTGTGKTRIALNLINHLVETKYKGKKISLLLLVAKRVHKQTWKDEISKWGGLNVDSITMECYESMHKHTGNHYTFILMDEIHHVKSETRMQCLAHIKYDYMLGLSATIPRKLKQVLSYRYKAAVVSCDISEAIEDNILPEPQILLFPLMLEDRAATETWEINAKAKGQTVYGDIKDIWKYKKQKVHAILSCTQKRKLIEFNNLIAWEKNQYMMTGKEPLKQSWLYHAGKRLEWLADIKTGIIKDILKHLDKHRTITFCKSIAQAETVGKYCIHSKNADADKLYNDFNARKIDHITAVNILNENANLVDCKYAVFCNLSSSDLVSLQRLGRSLRHKSPVIIFPYYTGTREEEIVKEMLADFNKDYIKTITNIKEI